MWRLSGNFKTRFRTCFLDQDVGTLFGSDRIRFLCPDISNSGCCGNHEGIKSPLKSVRLWSQLSQWLNCVITPSHDALGPEMKTLIIILVQLSGSEPDVSHLSRGKTLVVPTMQRSRLYCHYVPQSRRRQSSRFISAWIHRLVLCVVNLDKPKNRSVLAV